MCLPVYQARTRVLEWKRRQSDGLKENIEEVATLEQKERAEAALEAARKLAATRAEEAERRLVTERENAAGIDRAADVAEKWAKHSLEKRQRRAEIYAINAIMRYLSLYVSELSHKFVRVRDTPGVFSGSYNIFTRMDHAVLSLSDLRPHNYKAVDCTARAVRDTLCLLQILIEC